MWNAHNSSNVLHYSAGKIKSRLKLIFVPVVRNEMEDGYVECTQ